MGFSINPPQRIVFVGLGTIAQSFLSFLRFTTYLL